jgi:hypothetical protein
LVYVSGGDSVTPVDVATGHAGALISIGTTSQALALADGGRSAWVCGGNGNLIQIDLTTGAVLGHVAVGGQPAGIAIANQPVVATSP